MHDEAKAGLYGGLAEARKRAIQELLWDPEENQWFDYDVKEKMRKSLVSASNFHPLWAGAAYPEQVRSNVFHEYQTSRIYRSNQALQRLQIVNL